MRLIDADVICKKLAERAIEYLNVDECTVETIKEDMKIVNRIPTMGAEPVVRCKDCKYWQDNNDGYPHEECRWGNGETPDANDFCSYGERKEGATDGC